MTVSNDRAVLARRLLDQTDEQALQDCDVDTYRASGPGGQKRNKTSSAVRLRHRPSGLSAIAEETRSQHQNKAGALRRLREKAAIEGRLIPPERIEWPSPTLVERGRLNVGARNPHRFHVIAMLLDVLWSNGGVLSESARQLGVTASSMTSFLAEHPKAWAEANRIRAEAGLPALRR